MLNSYVRNTAKGNGKRGFPGNEAFKELWHEVNNAVWDVCANKSFADLVELEQAKRDKCVPNYNI